MREQSVLVNDAIAQSFKAERGTGLNGIAWGKSHSAILIMIYC